jgi:hypothetical protein
MKLFTRIAFVLAIAFVALSAGQAHAATSTWKPGSTYYVSEDDATSFLERAFDYAYCRGIARYGKRGEFPDEEFTRFDCTVEMDDGSTCYDVREIAVKGTRPGYYRMKIAKAQTKMWCS